jgi:hypothetical protein
MIRDLTATRNAPRATTAAPALARILALALLCAWGALTAIASAATLVGAAAAGSPISSRFSIAPGGGARGSTRIR